MMTRVAVIAGGALFVATGLYWALEAVQHAARGDYENAIMFGGGSAIFVGIGVAARKFGTNDIAPRIETDDGGTTFRPDRWLDIPLQVSGFGVIALFVGFAHWPSTDRLPFTSSVATNEWLTFSGAVFRRWVGRSTGVAERSVRRQHVPALEPRRD